MLTHHEIKIGDTARFPLGRLGDDEVYRYRWEAIAFRNGLVVARRLHDGVTRELSAHWWHRYTLDYRPRKTVSLPRRLPPPKLNADRSKPGFYVSAIDSGPSKRGHVLLAGPFSYPGDARRVESRCRHLLSVKYPGEFNAAIGCCKLDHSTRDGAWNTELGLLSAK